MLANQARLEQIRDGYVSTKCPKCDSTPEVITTPNGERSSVRCKCGYVASGEIYF